MTIYWDISGGNIASKIIYDCNDHDVKNDIDHDGADCAHNYDDDYNISAE